MGFYYKDTHHNINVNTCNFAIFGLIFMNLIQNVEQRNWEYEAPFGEAHAHFFFFGGGGGGVGVGVGRGRYSAPD